VLPTAADRQRWAAGRTVTLRVDVANWFPERCPLCSVDPASGNKGQANESVVRGNIEASFEAFRDDNHDGHDDDGIDHYACRRFYPPVVR